MQRWLIATGFFSVLLLGALSVLYLSEARAARRERQSAVQAFGDLARDFSHKLDVRQGELRSALVAGEGRDREMLELLRHVDQSLKLACEADALAAVDPLQSGADDALSHPIEQPSPPPLPEIPADVDARRLLVESYDLEALASNPMLNPEGRSFSRVERLGLLAELKQGQARYEALDAAVKLSVGKAMETLRERGEYVEYRPGERYETVPGVRTAGEETADGGVRMFYLHRDEFQEVYENEVARDAAVERATRRILARLQGVDPGGEP